MKKAVPRRRPRPVVETKKSNTPILLAAAGGAVVLLLVLILAFSGGKKKNELPVADAKPVKEVKAWTPKPSPKKDNPKPKGGSEIHVVDAPQELPKDYLRKIDIFAWRINLSVIAATYLDYKAKHVRSEFDKRKALDAARDLRVNILSLEKRLGRLVAAVKATGKKAYIPDLLKATDRITLFENHDLAKITAESSVRLLGKFISKLRGGDRARVVFVRSSQTHEKILRFDERPPELTTIMQVADLIPGQGDPLIKKKDPVTNTDPDDPVRLDIWSLILGDPDQALRHFERMARHSDLARVIVEFLKSDEAPSAELKKYLSEVNPTDHLGFIAKLARNPKLRRFADAHLSDIRDPKKAKKGADLLGYEKSADGKVWGSKEAVGIYDAAHGDPTSVRSNAFEVKLMVLLHKVRAGRDLRLVYGEAKKLARSAKGGDKAILEGIADRIEKAGRCTDCNRGKLSCGKCHGKKKVTMTCPTCDGDGKCEVAPGSDAFYWCKTCKKTGKVHGIPCDRCKQKGKIDCPMCDKHAWKTTVVVDLGETRCGSCEGRGTTYRRVAHACGECKGVGRTLSWLDD